MFKQEKKLKQLYFKILCERLRENDADGKTIKFYSQNMRN